MVKNDRKIENIHQRLAEVNEILKYLSPNLKNKIPKAVFYSIKDNMDKSYKFEIDKTKKIYEQDINRDTIAILSYINLTYLVNDEQREYLNIMYKMNEEEE